jgi:hypothetical protein
MSGPAGPPPLDSPVIAQVIVNLRLDGQLSVNYTNINGVLQMVKLLEGALNVYCKHCTDRRELKL